MKTKNKHGRKGKKKHHDIGGLPQSDYMRGYLEGKRQEAERTTKRLASGREFLEMLLTKRNAKDIHGLVTKELAK